MVLADANRVRVAYVKELVFGETPATPTLQVARITSNGLVYNKTTERSNELRSDRQVPDHIELAASSGGPLGFELSLGGAQDVLLEALLGSTFSTPLAGTPTQLDVVASTRTITDFGASGAFTNAVVGMGIFLAGFTNEANNGWHVVESVTDTNNVVVETLTLEDETGSGDETAKGKTLINGTDANSFSFEVSNLDIDYHKVFKGQRLGSFNLAIAAEAIVTGTWTVQGTEGTQMTQTPVGSVYTPAGVNPVVNATSNVARLVRNGVAYQGALQDINITLDNNLRNQSAVGFKFPAGIGYGSCLVTGTMSGYLADGTWYNDMIAHNDVGLRIPFDDGVGNGMLIELPRIKIGSDEDPATGIDTDIIENLSIMAAATLDGTRTIQISVT